jgi:hypothetical protein
MFFLNEQVVKKGKRANSAACSWLRAKFCATMPVTSWQADPGDAAGGRQAAEKAMGNDFLAMIRKQRRDLEEKRIVFCQVTAVKAARLQRILIRLSLSREYIYIIVEGVCFDA